MIMASGFSDKGRSVQGRCFNHVAIWMRDCESWTLYRRHIAKLDQFHLRCLRRLAHIRWQDMTPNTTVLERCEISGMEEFLIAAQLRWAGHVIRMDDHRIPKQVCYSQLVRGSRTSGGQMKRYKDTLKVNLKA